MNINQKFITQNQCFKNNTKIKIKGIVLHSVGVPQPKADAFFNSFNNPTVQKAVHAFVQADGYVLQTLPWDVKAWHCGGACNSTHIGVEMTEPSTIKYVGGAQWIDTDSSKTSAFVHATYKTAVELFAYLCKMYGLNPLEDGVILSHHEAYLRGKASNHGDVEHIWNRFGLTMNKFRQDVNSAMKSGSAPETNPVLPIKNTQEGKFYQVNLQEGASSLNIRNNPDGEVIGSLKNRFIIYIVEEKNGWGKISTGGWVKLEYLTPFNNGFDYIAKKYIATIKADSLNVRSTPEIKNGNIVGTVKQGQKYTIVGVYKNFGLLISGAGNISIDYRYVSLKEV